MADKKKQLLIVTGMSGAGKTVASHALEDMGYFVVDNLPPTLLSSFWDLIINSDDFTKVAVVLDLRIKSFYKDLLNEVNSLEDNSSVQTTVVFLDASNDALVARYKETRRVPPLATSSRLLDGILAERQVLTGIKNRANDIIDTSNLTPKELRQKLLAAFSEKHEQPFSIEVLSFGFKYGMPIDADIVMDVRFLPNPFYIPELRPFTGLDKRVFDYVMEKKETRSFYQKLLDLLQDALPGYIKEGKGKLTIAIGCTGGQHRSVAIAKQLAQDLARDYPVDITHREISRYTKKG
ncbi:RNase adapter RapZ [Lactobacillus xylocopicola]|uniref:Nucleotide-binding protein n=1 Tax=Lactobacillus xylocopicola TaxID=2976676 RepID=A0ABM8BG77_9LACO|nr:RNase adapter RapZ [Lactobacillus xylocopicola]BDR60255.1 nucleotide-binding protein [Lactobacillus xylocopicola]